MESVNYGRYKSPFYKIGRFGGKVIGMATKLLLCLIFAFPFYWMFITSFKTKAESIQWPPTLWPTEFTTAGYETVVESVDLLKYLKNSVIIIIAVMVIQIAIMIPAAYAFAKYEFKFKGLLFGLVIMAYMTPTVITFIPVYIMFARIRPLGINLLNTLLPQILPFGANAFGIFLLRQNFMQIPDEIIESARLDNASEIRIMTRIMLPMARPTLVTVALLSFIDNWNAYFWPLVMCRTDDVKPIILAIADLRNLDSGIIWPTVMAGNVLIMLPILVLFIFASKQIIAALAYNGVK